MIPLDRPVTACLFTEAEQAQNHAHIGNVGLTRDVIAHWLDSVAHPTPRASDHTD